MLRIVAVGVQRVLPGWQAHKRLAIEAPIGAVAVADGVLLLDAGRITGGGPQLHVPWSKIDNVEMEADGYDAVI